MDSDRHRRRRKSDHNMIRWKLIKTIKISPKDGVEQMHARQQLTLKMLHNSNDDTVHHASHAR